MAPVVPDLQESGLGEQRRQPLVTRQRVEREQAAADVDAAVIGPAAGVTDTTLLNVLALAKKHLGSLDHLRQGIHLRGYAQKQPKQEYKRESFELFEELLEKVKRDVTAMLRPPAEP